MKNILTVLLFSITCTATAQKAVFKWDDELCTFESTYDTKKISLEQIKNCYRLALKGELEVTISPMIFKPQDMEKQLHPEKLEEQFTTANTALKKMDLPKTPFWEGFKAAKLKEQQQRYEFYRTAFKAYKDVNALKEYPSKSKEAQHYANVLITGGDLLLAEWSKIVKEKAKNNGNPEWVISEYENRLASPEKLRYAFVDVMNFGWHNSANHAIETADEVYSSEMVNKEWEKLFLKTKTIHCDEP